MEDRRISGEARIAAGCAVLSLLVVTNSLVGIYFGVMGAIFAGSCAINGPTGRRTRRVALVSALVSVLAVTVGLALLITAPPDVYRGE